MNLAINTYSPDNNTFKLRKYSLIVFIVYYFLVKKAYLSMYQVYQYIGFDYEFNSQKQTISISIFFSIILALHFFKKMDSFYWTVISFIFLMFTIPMLVYYEFNPKTDEVYLFGHLILILFLILCFIKKETVSLKKNKLKVKNKNILYFLVFLLILPFAFTYGFNFNFDVFSLMSDSIYEARNSSIKNGNILTRYFEGWLSRAICPILLTYGFIKKDMKTIIYSLVILLYIYLISAHKSLFLGIILIFVFYFLKGYEKKVLFFSSFMCILIIIPTLLESMDVSSLILPIVSYRFLFVPVEVGTYYFDFFNENYTYWSQSPFNPFILYKYNLSPAYLIGEKYLNDSNVGANTGIIADGFMNFGVIGIFINVLLFVLIIKLWRNNISENYFGVLFTYLIAFQNSSLNTIILTHGLVVVFLMFYFFEIDDVKRL